MLGFDTSWHRLQPVSVVLALLLCACVPGPVPPPLQYQPLSGPDPPMLELGSSNPDVRILGDVMEAPGARGALWTHAHPRLSFQLNRTHDLDFHMRFGVHTKTFADTGPVTLTIRLNGEVIDRPRIETPGVRDYTHPAPERVLQLHNPVEVAIDVAPGWVAEDKEVLGILLFMIGFEEHRQ